MRRGVAEEEAGREERGMSLQGYAGAEEEDDEEKERVGRDERDVLRHLHPHLEWMEMGRATLQHTIL